MSEDRLTTARRRLRDVMPLAGIEAFAALEEYVAAKIEAARDLPAGLPPGAGELVIGGKWAATAALLDFGRVLEVRTVAGTVHRYRRHRGRMGELWERMCKVGGKAAEDLILIGKDTGELEEQPGARETEAPQGLPYWIVYDPAEPNVVHLMGVRIERTGVGIRVIGTTYP